MAPGGKFSPYNLGLGFVKATGLDRVFRGRVAKAQASPSAQRQARQKTPHLEAALAAALPGNTPTPEVVPSLGRGHESRAADEGATVHDAAPTSGAPGEHLIIESVETEIKIEVDQEDEEDQSIDEEDEEDSSSARGSRRSGADVSDEDLEEDGDLEEDEDLESEGSGEEDADMDRTGGESSEDELAAGDDAFAGGGDSSRLSMAETPEQGGTAEDTSYVDGDASIMSQASKHNPFRRYTRGLQDDEDDSSEWADPPPPAGEEEAGSDWQVDAEAQREFDEARAQIPGHDEWDRELSRSHRLLSLRGRHPLMTRDWEFGLIDNAMLPELFAPAESTKPVLMRAMSGQFKAAKALRRLLDLQGRANALRQVGRTGQIAGVVQKEIEGYIKWSKLDAGLDRHEHEPSILVVRFDRGDVAPQELAAMMREGLAGWAKRYRRRYRAKGVRHYPRLLYGFVIIQQLVLVAAVRCSDPEPRPLVFAELNVTTRDRWLDTALGIAIPVHLAREALLACRDHLPELPAVESDDPDR